MMKSITLMTRVLVFVTVIAVIMSCKPQIPSEYIQPDTLEDILYDYHLGNAMANRRGGDSAAFNRIMYYHSVLKKYNVTEADFDSSMVYYHTHAEILSDIYKRLAERVESAAELMGANVADAGIFNNLSLSGDTANIWHERDNAILMQMAPYNRIDFKIDSDTLFEKGDELILSFNNSFIYQGGAKDAVTMIAVTFENDSVASYVNHVMGSGMARLRVPGNNDKKIKSVRGFIYLCSNNGVSNALRMMLIDNIRLIRMHVRQPEPKQPAGASDSLRKDTVSVAHKDSLNAKKHFTETYNVSDGKTSRGTINRTFVRK
ncbi:DUF4296 domain-containing protein [Xylanibacter muris]|uniref:DUF4296 domain-containing protein n=1 Tax=Xylanibacter muris TaxID=2736290 RepID=A0ABX2ALY4_9BACT|nr:DUF4296 domain-containing protein [Xylanibacter muris]NPD92208.1 DUF4296 domain-containing protein [Xylanibacter muris]